MRFPFVGEVDGSWHGCLVSLCTSVDPPGPRLRIKSVDKRGIDQEVGFHFLVFLTGLVRAQERPLRLDEAERLDEEAHRRGPSIVKALCHSILFYPLSHAGNWFT
jgi:hypothetical protein